MIFVMALFWFCVHQCWNLFVLFIKMGILRVSQRKLFGECIRYVKKSDASKCLTELSRLTGLNNQVKSVLQRAGEKR